MIVVSFARSRSRHCILALLSTSVALPFSPPRCINKLACRSGFTGATTVGMPKERRQRRLLIVSADPTCGEASLASSSLSGKIIAGLEESADTKTKDWFTNYVKGSTWIGCKTPTVRQVVRQSTAALGKHKDSETSKMIVDEAIVLLQHAASDAKLGGMMLLQEHLPATVLATRQTLDRLSTEVLAAGYIDDWSSADWLAVRVLQKIVLEGKEDERLAEAVLDFTSREDTNLWHRRCGVVTFVHFYKRRNKLPSDIGVRLVQACESSMLKSPTERFTQTGIAWVLRYMLVQPQSFKEERDAAMDMIVRHGQVWTMEAKRSFTEKMAKSDPRKKQILGLGS